MKIMVVDTETSGLPLTSVSNPLSLHLFPYILQLSYIIYDTNLNEIISTYDTLIKTDIEISQESTNVHGITQQKIQESGIDLTAALTQFVTNVKTVDMLVGHNIKFDINMIKTELYRFLYPSVYADVIVTSKEVELFRDGSRILNQIQTYCTMAKTKSMCNIECINNATLKPYIKFPSLGELHNHLFGYLPDDLHNSLIDCFITLKCYIHIKK